nr:PREDICTED: uncharacterized protein LOC103312512 [Tribolium castaneum]|eukprot:XP_008191547.1 PREDICTED: uncharacterized protein LOC103312512 [Tribolium castaneum]
MLSKDLKIANHVQEVIGKAEKTAMAIMRAQPNVGGPKEQTRKLYAQTAISIVLYAAPTWMKACNVKKLKSRLEQLNGRLAIRVASAYKTARREAVCIIAGMPPLELQAIERCNRMKGETKIQARKKLMDAWQKRWHATEDCWTKKLIRDIEPWVERKHGALNYNLTQILTGRGVFNTF